MGLETGTYIDSLNAANPLGTDAKSAGDDHLRLIKSTIKNTFPNITGAVTPTQVELNYVDGVTSAIQPQLDNKQPLDATLAALAALATGADKLAYSTGADTFAETPLTAFARTLLDDADAATARGTLGVGIQANSSTGYTATATLTSADIGRAVFYNSGTAGTLTLPAIPAAGNMVAISNINTGVCTVARAGTSNIYAKGLIAQTSITLALGESIELVSSGSDWVQVSGNRQAFTSADQTITSAGTLTLAHGLSVIPKSVSAWLRCTVADGGYSVGDVLLAPVTTSNSTDDSKGMSIVVTNANLIIRFGSAAAVFSSINKTTGVGFGLVNTSWAVYFTATP